MVMMSGRLTRAAAREGLIRPAPTSRVADDSDRRPGRDAPTDRDAEPTDSGVDVFDVLRAGPTRFLPVRTGAARRDLGEGDRKLLHCLACGRQVVARRHGDACLLCGSAAIIVETVSGSP